MRDDTMYRCSRCKTSKPLAEFPPSRAHRPQWCRLCLREDKCGKPTERACDGCGVVLTVTALRAARPRVFCSRACKDERRKAEQRAARLVEKAAAPPRHCPHCGDALDPSMRVDARFCSDKCMNAAHNATRKAKWKTGRPAEYVSRSYIVERDGGRCHHCGRDCRGDLHLDHLVPLAYGGDHSTSNLVVSCPRCNLTRRHTGAAQLLLVG